MNSLSASLRASERLNCSVRASIWLSILATTLMNFLWNSSRALHNFRQEKHWKNLEIWIYLNATAEFTIFHFGVLMIMFHQWSVLNYHCSLSSPWRLSGCTSAETSHDKSSASGSRKCGLDRPRQVHNVHHSDRLFNSSRPHILAEDVAGQLWSPSLRVS